MEEKYTKEDLLFCEWLAEKQISYMGLALSGNGFFRKILTRH